MPHHGKPITNEICQTTGHYKVIGHEPFNDKHPKEYPVKEGEKFPPCSHCGKHIKFELIKDD